MLAIAATLVLVLSFGMTVVAGFVALPHTSTTASASSTSTATATTTTAATTSTETDPHVGTIEAYLNEPNGANTVDPAIAYYTVDYEPIMNVYETLVNYNGSSTSSFIPTLATCVPGTTQCTSDYGSGSISGFTGIFNQAGSVYTGTNGLPTYWTFVVDPAAKFYDPGTHASWSVYPSDVMFSIARTAAFADPFGENPGWIISQSLLPFTYQGPLSSLCDSNPADCWDSVHSGFNNTPYDVMSSMLVNDSAYCPATAMNGVDGNGCITFVADSGALGAADFPEFLDFVADNLGASVVPCGYYSYVGAGLPGWSGTNAANGDGSCKLPGDASSTTSTGFQTYLGSVANNTATDPGLTGIYTWDALENRSWDDWPAVQPAAQSLLIGSGPYYGSIDLATGYGLGPNPAYAQPSACGGNPSTFAQYSGYCDPAAGGYIGNVQVTFETGDAEGLTAYEAGTADWADIEVNHFSEMLELQANGQLNILNTPSLSVFQQNYVMNWNSTERSKLGLTGTNNIPSNFFAQEAARGLLQTSYPFSTIESNVWTSEGLQALVPVGGQIPDGMACYYAPTTTNGCDNTYTVPFTDQLNGGQVDTNVNTVGSAAWWWQQGTDPSSVYYSEDLANCTVTSPCYFTIESSTGDPSQDAANSLWAQSIQSVTGGAVVPNTADISAEDLLDDCGEAANGNNPCAVYNFGWIPDYPDPTDYEAAYGVANGTYTSPDGASSLFAPGLTNTATCGHVVNSGASYSANLKDAAYWANVANTTAIANDCQGVAYLAFLWTINTAAPLSASPERILLYDLSQTIINALDFYTWTGQENVYFTAAPWIATSSINTNVMIGTGDDQFWFQFKYATSQVTTAETFKESGLPKGTIWNVIIDGQTYSSLKTTLTVGLPTGTYSYKLIGTSQYAPQTATGSLTVTSSPATIKAKFLNEGTTVTFTEKGLAKGTPWQVTILDTNYTSTSTKISLRLPAGSFGYAVTPVNLANGTEPVPGYHITVGASGTLTTAPPKNLNVKVDFAPYTGYGATFTPSGLPNEKWSVSLKLVKGTGLASPKPSSEKSLTNGSIVFPALANGTYTYKAAAKGFVTATGTVTVNGASISTTVTFTAKSKPALVSNVPEVALLPNLVAPAATPSRAQE